jgi:Rieske Fe-S protein
MNVTNKKTPAISASSQTPPSLAPSKGVGRRRRPEPTSSQQQSPPPQSKISRDEVLSSLARFQQYMGLVFVASAAFGVYLLATDGSLWKLAVSHAYGLVFIVVVDVALGAANLLAVRQAYLPSMAWALLTLVLQLGDIVTAPQYRMTMQYFASYLFGLWAFDSLLVAQAVVVALGLIGRESLSATTTTKKKKKKKQLNYFQMVSRNSRRDFLQIGGTIAALVTIAGILGFVESLGGSSGQPNLPTETTGANIGASNTTNNLPSGAIANMSQLQQPLSPLYFEYPSGYPNVLFKKSDGTVSALSMLCTHVCCETNFQGNGELYCGCHGSLFDQNGKVLRGPAVTALPSVELSIDANGNIFPKSIKGSSPCVG